MINPLALIFTFLTAFGVLFHDTQADRATVAFVVPVIAAGYAAVDTAIKFGDSHTHVERVHGPKGFASTLRSTVPRIQPRDDERHIHAKKVYYTDGNASHIWPSV